jgi:pimeloyl-ACP methyl ester carboxylesterase
MMAERYGDPESQVWALHGWGRSRRDWEPVLFDRDAVSFDLPGFGATSAPATPWTTLDYAQALLAGLPDGQTRVLAGHSFGGRIAVQMAALAPQKVRALVLTGVPLLRRSGGGKPKFGYRVARWLHAHQLLGDARMEAYRQRYGSADYRAAVGVMRTIMVSAVNEDYADQLRMIAEAGIPVVMVWGADDTEVPVAIAQAARGILGEAAELTVVDGATHQLDDHLAEPLRAALRSVSA